MFLYCCIGKQIILLIFTCKQLIINNFVPILLFLHQIFIYLFTIFDMAVTITVQNGADTINYLDFDCLINK